MPLRFIDSGDLKARSTLRMAAGLLPDEEEFFDIAVGEPVAQVPADRGHVDVRRAFVDANRDRFHFGFGRPTVSDVP